MSEPTYEELKAKLSQHEQWNRLLGAANEIKAFLEENKSKLKLKDQG